MFKPVVEVLLDLPLFLWFPFLLITWDSSDGSMEGQVLTPEFQSLLCFLHYCPKELSTMMKMLHNLYCPIQSSLISSRN